jgi:hypothetical protein
MSRQGYLFSVFHDANPTGFARAATECSNNYKFVINPIQPTVTIIHILWIKSIEEPFNILLYLEILKRYCPSNNIMGLHPKEVKEHVASA